MGRIPLLKNLIVTVLKLLPNIFYIFCLLSLIGYVYGVLCTTLFRDLYRLGYTKYDYFSRLDYTFFTLFQIVTLEWAFIVRQVVKSQQYNPYFCMFIFNSFLFITGVILYKMIIAVFCDSFIEAQMERRRKKQFQRQERRKERARRRSRRKQRAAEKKKNQQRSHGLPSCSDAVQERVQVLTEKMKQLRTPQAQIIQTLEQLQVEFEESIVDHDSNAKATTDGLEMLGASIEEHIQEMDRISTILQTLVPTNDQLDNVVVDGAAVDENIDVDLGVNDHYNIETVNRSVYNEQIVHGNANYGDAPAASWNNDEDDVANVDDNNHDFTSELIEGNGDNVDGYPNNVDASVGRQDQAIVVQDDDNNNDDNDRGADGCNNNEYHV